MGIQGLDSDWALTGKVNYGIELYEFHDFEFIINCKISQERLSFNFLYC